MSCGGLPLEELFVRGGPLRSFLERQAGCEAHLKVRGPELVAVAKLLREKEQELQETEHLLRGKGRAQGSSIQSRFLTLRLPFPQSRWSDDRILPELEAVHSVAFRFRLDPRSVHLVHSDFFCLSL